MTVQDTAPATTPAIAETRAGVVEAENGWEDAEVRGDTGFLQMLLSDDYVSVSADGKAYVKSDIIAGAVRYARNHPGEVGKPLDATTTIQVFGDTAVVRHRGHGQLSVDIMQKRGGRWVAWFSQHTANPSTAN